jgi:hypothetical protein
LSIFGAPFSEIKKTYDSFSVLNRSTALRAGEDFASGFKVAKAKVKDFGDAAVKTMKQVRESSKKSSESALAAILDSINEDSISGKRNKDFLNEWGGASSDDRIKLLETADKSMKDYLETVDESGPTWEGFVKYQKNAAAQIEATGIKSKLAAVGLNIFKAAAGMLVTVIAQFAIQKLIEGLDYLIHMQDKLDEKAEASRTQYKETTEELNNQEEALKKVKDRLVELEAIKNPSLADKAETEELKKQNQELSLQIEYYKKKQEIEEEQARKDDEKAWGWYTHYKDENSARRTYFKSEYNLFGESSYDKDLATLKQLNKAKEEYNNLYKQGYDLETLSSEKARLEKEIADLEASLSKSVTKVEKYQNPEAIKFAEKMKFALLDADQKAEALHTKLSSIAVNDSAVSELERVARYVGDDKSSKSMEDFKKALHKAIPDEEEYDAFVEFAGSIDALAASFGNSTAATDEYAQTVSEMQDLADLSKIFGNWEDASDEAKESINKFLSLTGDEFRSQFEEKFGGLSDEVQDFLSSVFQIDGIDSSQIFEFFGSIGEIAQEFVNESERVSESYSKAADNLSTAFGKSLDGVSGNIDSAKELSIAMTAVKATYDDLTAAMEEQNNTGEISLQTYLSLIEKNSKYAEVLEIDETGAIHLATDARKKMVMTQIQAIQTSIQEEINLKQSQLAMYKFRGTLAVLSQAIFDDAIKPSIKFAAVLNVLKQALAQIKAGKFTTMNFSNMFESEVNKMLAQAGKSSSDYNNKYANNVKNLQSEISQLEKYKANVGRIQNVGDFDTYYSGGSSKSKSSSSPSSSSSSSSDDPRLKAWNEMLAVKKHQLEMDQITEEQYYAWLEANYKKQLNNQKKYAEEWRKYEEEIYKWKKQKRLDDWNEAVDLKKHELEMGKIDEGEYYAWLAANYKKYLNDKTKYAEEWRENEEAIHKFEEQQAKDSQDALEDLIDLRIDMLKQEKNNEKDVLKERQDNVKDFYDKQRDLLKEHYDQIDKEEERREKRKKVTDIQAELLELEADDSVEAQKRRLELEESLSDAKKDLNDFERDEELDKAEKMYDDLEEMQTQYYEKQIEAIEDYLDNAYELRQQAIKDLQNGNAQLYQEMIEYNRSYGSTIDADVTAKWEAAYEALNRYNSLLDDDYGMKLDNMTGYNKGKYETAAEREARERATQRTSAKDAAQTIAKNAGKSSGSSNTSQKSGPNRGDKVTIKKSATHFSSQSGNAKMASHVPGGKYTVYQVKGNQVLIGVNGAYTGWVWKSDIQGYATGTPYAKGGIANIDEKGLELILGSPDKGRYKFLNDGDKVFNAKASEFLYKWANQPGEVLSSMIKSLSAASSVSIASPCNITVGDVVINGSADEKTVGELRRAHKQIVTDILNEFKKMKK